MQRNLTEEELTKALKRKNLNANTLMAVLETISVIAKDGGFEAIEPLLKKTANGFLRLALEEALDGRSPLALRELLNLHLVSEKGKLDQFFSILRVGIESIQNAEDLRFLNAKFDAIDGNLPIAREEKSQSNSPPLNSAEIDTLLE